MEPGNIEFHGLMNETECARLNSLNILGYYLLVETVRGLILSDRLFERRQRHYGNVRVDELISEMLQAWILLIVLDITLVETIRELTLSDE